MESKFLNGNTVVIIILHNRPLPDVFALYRFRVYPPWQFKIRFLKRGYAPHGYGLLTIRCWKMNRNVVFVILLIFISGLVALGVWRDWSLMTPSSIECEDGPRQRIDVREFATQYWAYGVTFRAKIKEHEIEGKFTPQILRRLSEAQQALETFQKWLVHSYNACIITKSRYAEYGIKYQSLNSLSQNLQKLISSSSSQKPSPQLEAMVEEYFTLATKFGTPNP